MAAVNPWPATTGFSISWVNEAVEVFQASTFLIPAVRRAAESASTLLDRLRRPVSRPPTVRAVLEPLRPVQRVFCVALVYRTAREYRLRPGMRRLARA